MADLSTNPTTKTITLDKVASVISEIVNIEFDKNIIKFIKTQLSQYDLKVLDQIRDVILHKKGNETLVLTSSSVGESENGSAELSKFIDDIIKRRNSPIFSYRVHDLEDK